MSPRFRQLALTVHVIVSVSWLGAAGAVLALALAGLHSDNPQRVRSAYITMEMLGQAVLMPLSLASLGTGLIQAFSTPWGLVRHYWVVFKLLITVFATLVLVLYLPTFRAMAETAADPTIPLSAVRNGSPVLHGSAALVLLMGATFLSVLKPRGLTPFGHRWQRARKESASAR